MTKPAHRTLSPLQKRIVDMSPAEFVDFVFGTARQTTEHRPAVFDSAGIDFYGDDYYSQIPPADAAQKIGLVALEFASLTVILKQVPALYAKGGITTGLQALEQAIAHHLNTVHELSKAIGSDKMGDMAREPNTRAQLTLGIAAQKSFPDHATIVPMTRELSIVRGLKHPLFGRLGFEEVDFMLLWRLLERVFIDRGLLARDAHTSNSTIDEAMEEIARLVRLVPEQNQPFAITDINGNPLGFRDHMEKFAETIKLLLGSGSGDGKVFDFRKSANAFARTATIVEWLCTNDPRVAKASKKVRDLAKAERDSIRALRAEIDPLIEKYGAHFLLRPDELLPEYQAMHQAAEGAPEPRLTPEDEATFRAFREDIMRRKGDIIALDTTPEVERRLAEAPTPLQRRFDAASTIFSPESRALFFHDPHLYSACRQWEQALLPLVIYTMEIVQPPANNPQIAVVFDDFKRGKHAQAYARAHGIENIDDAVAHAGDRAQELIIGPAREESRQRVGAIRAAHPGKIVLGPEEFDFIISVIEHLRAAMPQLSGDPHATFCGDGSPRTSDAFRLLLQKTFMERNANQAFFPEGWESSPKLVQLRTAARNIQAGFTDRPIEGPVHFNVFTGMEVEDLTADARALIAEFRRCADTLLDAPEQGLALARLVALDQLVRTEIGRTATKGFINHATADRAVTDYNGAEMDRLLGLRDAAKAPASHNELQQANDDTLPAQEFLIKYATLWKGDEARLFRQPLGDDTEDHLKAQTVETALLRRFREAWESGQTREDLLAARPARREVVIHEPDAR